MICNKCGSEIKDGNSFCTNCGKAINESGKRKITFIIGGLVIILIIAIVVWNLNSEKAERFENTPNSNNTYIEETKKEITETTLNEMKIDVNIRANRDVEVTETWNISIHDVNTLFKTFKLDNSKYEGISNVRVIEIMEDGRTKEFTLIDTEMYHVTKDCYYGLVNSNGEFEIAWGIDTKNKTKTYKISYTIRKPIKIYNDCAELYWNFISSDFSIPITKIEGKINIETLINNIDEVKVWGHTKNEGTIEMHENYIIFESNNFEKENYLELRLAMPRDKFDLTNVIDKNMLNQIYEEETKEEVHGL